MLGTGRLVKLRCKDYAVNDGEVVKLLVLSEPGLMTCMCGG